MEVFEYRVGDQGELAIPFKDPQTGESADLSGITMRCRVSIPSAYVLLPARGGSGQLLSQEGQPPQTETGLIIITILTTTFSPALAPGVYDAVIEHQDKDGVWNALQDGYFQIKMRSF